MIDSQTKKGGYRPDEGLTSNRYCPKCETDRTHVNIMSWDDTNNPGGLKFKLHACTNCGVVHCQFFPPIGER